MRSKQSSAMWQLDITLLIIRRPYPDHRAVGADQGSYRHIRALR
jgi:hypothetical protein